MDNELYTLENEKKELVGKKERCETCDHWDQYNSTFGVCSGYVDLKYEHGEWCNYWKVKNTMYDSWCSHWEKKSLKYIK